MDRPVSPRRAAWMRGALRGGEPALRVRGRNVSWLLPAALLLGISAGDWNAPQDFRIITWLVLVPGLAAAVCGVAATVLFALATDVAYVLLDTSWDWQYREGPADGWLVLAGGILAVPACWLRVRARDLMMRVERAADATRLALLRPVPPGAGGLETAAVYLAADVAARVGGDFYDVQPSPHGPRVLLGDVQGKGTSAVDAAAAVLSAFREAAYYERDPAEVARRLESRMRRHNAYAAATGQHDERFATAVLLSFPGAGEDGWADLVNFGHPGPLVLGPGGRVRTLPEATGPPLGLAALAGGLPPVRRVRLAPEETLLMFTDGVTEARDGEGTFLPLGERLAAFRGEPEPGAVVDHVRRAVLRHTGDRLADDTAILAVRLPPAALRAPPDSFGGPVVGRRGMDQRVD
ncbi:PP2C family protein-serine/threonine phosphatase [Streptomyces sp. DSM 44917]|uniref:PP2C family protein-serine/threonine phosphatase n=1 Tax=Streptomyces boetiae TaxID=3075541 RepID=A0ABU2LAM7_9ACTN|nr:PP2C family protein-serine/threonine phosphatase [Streptomyces sp. DSM 44917]MDT0308604.1 PP2C family protein-serine/threonine phosphatase [Streptomyces sp. DSM 44917]